MQDTVLELKKRFQRLNRGLRVERQRFTLPLPPGQKAATVLDTEERRLSSYNLTNGSVLVFKDLGPQARCHGLLCFTFLVVLL